MFEVSLAILVLTCVVFLFIKNRRLPKRNHKESTALQPSSVTELSTTDSTRKLNVFYGTQTGTAEAFAYRVQALAEERDLICNVIDMKNFEPDDLTNTVSDSQVSVKLLAYYLLTPLALLFSLKAVVFSMILEKNEVSIFQ